MHSSALNRVSNGLFWVLFFSFTAAGTVAAQGHIPPLLTVEFSTGNADAMPDAPTIIAIHGLGDTAANFSRVFRNASITAHWVIPQAPRAYGRGFSWFPVRVPLDPQEDLAPGVERATREIDSLIEVIRGQRGRNGPLMVTGFSQGGVISFALAVGSRHPVSLAIPIAGALPLRTPIAKTTIPVVAIHGDRDSIVPLHLSRMAVRRIQEAGGQAQLIEMPGVQHRIPPSLRQLVFRTIRGYTPKVKPQLKAP